MAPLIPLFWTSSDVFPGFKTRLKTFKGFVYSRSQEINLLNLEWMKSLKVFKRVKGLSVCVFNELIVLELLRRSFTCTLYCLRPIDSTDSPVVQHLLTFDGQQVFGPRTCTRYESVGATQGASLI